MSETSLQDFLGRMLGWAESRAPVVESALRSIHLSTMGCTTLVLLGYGDVVPLAYELHRRTLGSHAPFVVCDPRRGNLPASVRAPANFKGGVDAFQSASGGSLCLRYDRMPADLASLAALVREPSAPVALTVCAEATYRLHPFVLRPAPIWVPLLDTRAGEVPRIVDAYADEAIDDLAAHATGFTRADREWVLERSASTLPEIEKGTRRVVALRQAGSLAGAAARLGMSHVSLMHWYRRRGFGRRSHPR